MGACSEITAPGSWDCRAVVEPLSVRGSAVCGIRRGGLNFGRWSPAVGTKLTESAYPMDAPVIVAGLMSDHGTVRISEVDLACAQQPLDLTNGLKA